MICDECRINEACCAITMLAGDRTITRHLCRSCMEKIQRQQPRDAVARLLSEAMRDSLMNAIAAKAATAVNNDAGVQHKEETSDDDNMKCSCCGKTFGEVKKKNQLGCPECVSAFGSKLSEYIEEMPSNKAAACITAPIQHYGSIADDANMGIHSSYRLREMNKMLEEAVKNEEYEKAARLRDEITTERQRSGV